MVGLTARVVSAWSARRAWAVTAVIAGLASLALAGSTGWVAGAFVACALFGWAYTAATGALIAWTTEIAPEQAAAGTAMLFVLLIAGQGVGATALGALATGLGPTAAFIAGAVVSACSAALAHPLGSSLPQK